MDPMLFSCINIAQINAMRRNTHTPATRCRIKMKRWGIKLYSRSVHHTESILLVCEGNVKNICPNNR